MAPHCRLAEGDDGAPPVTSGRKLLLSLKESYRVTNVPDRPGSQTENRQAGHIPIVSREARPRSRPVAAPAAMARDKFPDTLGSLLRPWRPASRSRTT